MENCYTAYAVSNGSCTLAVQTHFCVPKKFFKETKIQGYFRQIFLFYQCMLCVLLEVILMHRITHQDDSDEYTQHTIIL